MPNVRPAENRIKANVISAGTPITANILPESNAIKAKNTTVPSATTDHKGIIRIATDEEAIEGVSENTAITPHTLRLVTNYVHEQAEASNVWVINHNLNKKPSVTIVDTAGTVFTAQVDYNDENTCTVYINGITKGTAYLN